jgi:uncharacterized protein
MNRIHRILLAGAIAATLAVPVAAQRYSDSHLLLKAVRERDGVALERIVSDPSSTVINTRDQGTGEGALHIIVRRRDLSWLSFMLGKGARADIQTNDGTTPLGMASSIGWVEGVELLLRGRANVNLANNRGETPLILAVQARQAEVIPLLLRQGADPNHSDSVAGYSALDYARQDRRDTAIARLLESAPARPAATERFGPN